VSRSLNKVQLIGNVGKDPDVRTTSNGGKVAEFSLATSRSWNDTNGAGRQEKTEWHRCVAWNARGGGQSLADIVERYVKKGDRLYVEGSVEYRQWQDQNNQTRYSTDIRVRELIMLSPRGDGGGEFEGSRARATPAKAAAGASTVADEDFEDFPKALEDADDDLPF
jgi:single-strand DNA-binding protein